MTIRRLPLAGCFGLCALASGAAVAQEPGSISLAPIQVRGLPSQSQQFDVRPQRMAVDTAAAMKAVPGAALLNNGGVAGEVQYRGLSRYRNNVQIDGMNVASGGPNWMDPPLHYAPSALVQSVEVTRGIPSVADSIDQIGATVDAETRRSEYGSGEAFKPHGHAASTGRSVNNSFTVGGQVGVGNANSRLGLTGVTERARNTETPAGEIKASEFGRNQFGLDFGHRSDQSETTGFVRYQFDGDSGNPDLPLDQNYFHTWLAQLKNRTTLDQTTIQSRLSFNHVQHKMTNYRLREAPSINNKFVPGSGLFNGTDPDRRFIRARSQGLTTDVRLDHPLWGGTFSTGVNGYWSQHDARVANPDDASFHVRPFDSIRQDRYSVFGQWHGPLAPKWDGELGLRYTRVNTDAGSGYVAPSLPPPAQKLRADFAAADRSKHDDNLDFVAKLARDIGRRWTVHGAIARKTRSPYYLERYGYIPLEATAGSADANNTIGNVNVDPEVAYEINLGVDFSGQKLAFSPQVFYRHVDDYITALPIAGCPSKAVCKVSTVNGDASPLRYANVDARLYGFDLAARYQINARWQLRGGASYTRGERTDGGDNLYRIAPPRLRATLAYDHGPWHAELTERYVFAQTHTADSHLDYKTPARDALDTTSPETGGYALTHIAGSYQITEAVKFEAGVDNLFDREYRRFLSGYNRVQNSAIGVGQRLPGAGRNVYATLSADF